MQWLEKITSPFWRVVGWLIWLLTGTIGCATGILKFLTHLKQSRESMSTAKSIVDTTKGLSESISAGDSPSSSSRQDNFDKQVDEIRDESREIIEQIEQEAEEYRQRINKKASLPDKRQRLDELADLVNDTDGTSNRSSDE